MEKESNEYVRFALSINACGCILLIKLVLKEMPENGFAYECDKSRLVELLLIKVSFTL